MSIGLSYYSALITILIMLLMPIIMLMLVLVVTAMLTITSTPVWIRSQGSTDRAQMITTNQFVVILLIEQPWTLSSTKNPNNPNNPSCLLPFNRSSRAHPCNPNPSANRQALPHRSSPSKNRTVNLNPVYRTSIIKNNQ